MSRSADKLHARSIIASVLVPQYRFVNRAGGLGGPGVIGVSENAARPGRSVSAVTGYSAIVEAAMPISIGDVIDSDDQGRAIVAASGGYGTAESACPAGGLFELRCAFVGGGGLGGGGGGSGLVAAATLRQEPNKGWPAERPDYAGPLILIGWDDPPAWPGAQYDQWIRIDPVHAPIVANFSAMPVGPTADWVARWAIRFAPEIVLDARAREGKALRLYSETAGNASASWEASTDSADQAMLARLIAPMPTNNSSNTAQLLLRMTANTDSGTRAAYHFQTRSYNPRQVRLGKTVAGTFTQLGDTVTLPAGFGAADAVVWMEFSVIGTALTGRIWLDGTPRSEAITLTATDSSIASGFAGLGAQANAYTILADYLALAYDGNPPPVPA